MKIKYISTFQCLLVSGMLLTSCFPEQEVEPVDSPDDNAIVTITPEGDYASVMEGDTLRFEIAVDKMVVEPIDFEVVLSEGSTADEDDFVVAGGTLAAYSLSTTMEVIVSGDGLPETGETFAFEIHPDFAYDFQLNPNGDKEPLSVAVKNFDYSVDWSAGSYENEDFCAWEVDLDMYVLNATQTAGNLDGASAACPLEHGTLSGLPDDTYDIYVDYFDGSIPDAAGVTIPYLVTLSNNNGSLYTIEGSFNSDNVGESHVVGKVVVSGGTYTLYDDAGAELGPL